MARPTLSGPLFDSRGTSAVAAIVEKIQLAIAQQGVNDVKQRLSQVLKNPTGRYEAAIQTERQVPDFFVSDLGNVKGPWLEGVSSRNDTTRFKGYATFRQMTRVLDDSAEEIAETVLRSEIGRLS